MTSVDSIDQALPDMAHNSSLLHMAHQRDVAEEAMHRIFCYIDQVARGPMCKTLRESEIDKYKDFRADIKCYSGTGVIVFPDRFNTTLHQ